MFLKHLKAQLALSLKAQTPIFKKKGVRALVLGVARQAWF